MLSFLQCLAIRLGSGDDSVCHLGEATILDKRGELGGMVCRGHIFVVCGASIRNRRLKD
jgi:hypothetical protein